jgi:hypothetical protein
MCFAFFNNFFLVHLRKFIILGVSVLLLAILPLVAFLLLLTFLQLLACCCWRPCCRRNPSCCADARKTAIIQLDSQNCMILAFTSTGKHSAISLPGRFGLVNILLLSSFRTSEVACAYTVNKSSPFSRPQPGCHWSNSSWAGIIYFFPAQREFGQWHPGWGRENG